MNSGNLSFNSFYIELLHGLEQSWLAGYISQSLWMYPILEIIHIVGIVLLVGSVLMFDFRLIGFSKELPVESLSHHLLPWSLRGLLIVIPSGILLFITNAETLGKDLTFGIKISLIVVAGVNAGLFHLRYKDLQSRQDIVVRDGVVKAIAILSITLWIAIIACGRFLAY